MMIRGTTMPEELKNYEMKKLEDKAASLCLPTRSVVEALWRK